MHLSVTQHFEYFQLNILTRKENLESEGRQRQTEGISHNAHVSMSNLLHKLMVVLALPQYLGINCAKGCSIHISFTVIIGLACHTLGRGLPHIHCVDVR